jgi:excisionase family DNA binding protein
MIKKPFSPETLAERWNCSAEKVRQMVHQGELGGFRLGKLIRIPAIEVERIECLDSNHTTPSTLSNIVASLPLPLDAARIAADIRLARLMKA